MKNISYILLLVFFVGWGTSCNQDELLTEVPKDFLSPENSFTNQAGFEAAILDIEKEVRNGFVARGDGNTRDNALIGIDVDFGTWGALADPAVSQNVMYWNTMTPESGKVKSYWNLFYGLVGRANTVIGRADDPVVKWGSEKEKNAIVAEARFIRAFGYHFLANMWGGVPLVLEETTEAKYDYVRATREEVYLQCKEDLEFAKQWLLTEDELPGGRAPRAAAYHLLAEVEICLGNYDEAIAAASWVIDNPAYKLMTERFGVYKDFEFQGYDHLGPKEPWGDVYWDLFREGNFNRADGNKECIWNGQMDFDNRTQGGGGSGQCLERWYGVSYAGAKDINGVQNFLTDTLCGRPTAALISEYRFTTIWQFKDDWNRDIRNSKYNMQRDYYWLNPANEKYGQKIVPEDMSNYSVQPRRIDTPYNMKFAGCIHHGTGQENGQNHDGGRTWKDWYLMRLPETYLLRAEAYLMKGDKSKAAADINVVRNRAQATPVTDGEVDIDLILDERARELSGEEFRLSTLCRMGKLVEYIMKYNEAVNARGEILDDHLNLLPIPQSDIEANTEVEMEQNPGY